MSIDGMGTGQSMAMEMTPPARTVQPAASPTVTTDPPATTATQGVTTPASYGRANPNQALNESGGGSAPARGATLNEFQVHDLNVNALSGMLAMFICGANGMPNAGAILGDIQKYQELLGKDGAVAAGFGGHLAVMVPKQVPTSTDVVPPATDKVPEPAAAVDVGTLAAARIRDGAPQETEQRQYRISVQGNIGRQGATQVRAPQHGMAPRPLQTDIQATWDGMARQLGINRSQIETHSRTRVQPTIDNVFFAGLASDRHAGDNANHALSVVRDGNGQLSTRKWLNIAINGHALTGHTPQGKQHLLNQLHYSPDQLMQMYSQIAEQNPQLADQLNRFVDQIAQDPRGGQRVLDRMAQTKGAYDKQAPAPGGVTQERAVQMMSVVLIALNRNQSEQQLGANADQASHMDFSENDIQQLLGLTVAEADQLFRDAGAGLQDDVEDRFEGFQTISRTTESVPGEISMGDMVSDLAGASSDLSVGDQTLPLGQVPPSTQPAGSDDDPMAGALDEAAGKIQDQQGVQNLETSQEAVRNDYTSMADAFDRIDRSGLNPQDQELLAAMQDKLRQLAASDLERAQRKNLQAELQGLLDTYLQDPRNDEIRETPHFRTMEQFVDQVRSRVVTDARLERMLDKVPETARQQVASPVESMPQDQVTLQSR